jgi:hypothetical protein
MRTGIYVLQTTTISITTTEENRKLEQMVLTNASGAADVMALAKDRRNERELTPGVYRVLSTSEIEVSGTNIEVVELPRDKDIWPDPSSAIQATLHVSSDEVRNFFPPAARDTDVKGIAPAGVSA